MEDQAQEILNSAELKIIKKLGRGCQADVYEVEQIQTGQHFAVKIIITNGLSQKEKERAEFQVNSNLYISQKIHCSYFPIMFNCWRSRSSINILFELCEENAEAAFKKLQTYTSRYNYLLVLLHDILNALVQLEKLNIIHRDIKPENILLKKGVFKLADLGLSRQYNQENSCLTNDIGNRLGRSPQFSTGLYTVKTDIWSLGVNIFYLLQNTLPFDEESLIKIKNNPNDIQKVISSPSLAIDLQASGRRSKNILSFVHLALSQMVVIDPHDRISANELLSIFFDVIEEKENLFKNLVMLYLRQRQEFGEVYLILMLGYVEFYRMDGKIREQGQSNKRKICLKVKTTIIEIIVLMFRRFQFCSEVADIINHFISKWSSQLDEEMTISQRNGLKNIEDALELYRISKVRQKFPLIEWMVKTFKVLQQKTRGNNKVEINLWDIPLQLYKMI